MNLNAAVEKKVVRVVPDPRCGFREGDGGLHVFALPDLRELSLGKPQGLRARDAPHLPT